MGRLLSFHFSYYTSTVKQWTTPIALKNCFFPLNFKIVITVILKLLLTLNQPLGIGWNSVWSESFLGLPAGLVMQPGLEDGLTAIVVITISWDTPARQLGAVLGRRSPRFPEPLLSEVAASWSNGWRSWSLGESWPRLFYSWWNS